MKMLFSSNDVTEVSAIKEMLVRSGIPCAIRHESGFVADLHTSMYPELWIEKEEDYQLAAVLLASHGR